MDPDSFCRCRRFNSLVFVAWHGLLVIFSDGDVRFLGCVLGGNRCFAHFVHRWFTFDKRKSVRRIANINSGLRYKFGRSSITIGWLSSVAPGRSD